MLSTRTKQINTYGKRSKRVVDVGMSPASGPAPAGIISIFDDLPPPPASVPLASRMKKQENIITKSKAMSPKIVGKQRKKRLSPVLSPIRKAPRIAQLIQESHTVSTRKEEAQQPSKKVFKVATATKTELDGCLDSPARAPLVSYSANIPGSPAMVANTRGLKQLAPAAKPIPLKLAKPSKPVVNMDIIVLDDDGKTIRTERRVSRTGVETNPVKEVPKKSLRKKVVAKLPIAVDSDGDSAVKQPAHPKRSQRRQPAIIISDDSESDCGTVDISPPRKSLSTNPPNPKPLSRPPTVEVLIPTAPYHIPPTKPSVASKLSGPATPPKPKAAPVMARPPPAFQLVPSPVFKGRQMTPLKGIRRKGLFEPPSPPSPTLTDSDFDLSLDLSELSLESGYSGAGESSEQDFPQYLIPLLEECRQNTCGPHDFSSFIESFPYDPILQVGRSNDSSDLEFRKIGEASYSEVFGIGDVVLKVIPLRDESQKGKSGQKILQPKGLQTTSESEVDDPPPSDAQDVRKEIIVTRAMGEVYGGFVKFLKTYIVKGKYPELLLNLWDDYNERKGSESIRPDSFKLSQVYAIIVLPNGGPDLETYSFTNVSKTGWRQACSIFWQVAKSLAHAEHLVSFEHRDLHWGQILVKNIVSGKPRLKTINVNGVKSRKDRTSMDDLTHGVQTTIIDLGLSRMDAGDGSNENRVQWTPFDEEVFMGEGEYQFDIYRMMRKHTRNAWEGYHPLTNVMWLHYLTTKLLTAKGLKAPSVRKTKGAAEAPLPSSADAFSEKDCYESLLDIEQWLGASLADAFPSHSKAIIKSKGRRKTIAPIAPATLRDGPLCAGEVVAYAVKKGWINATTLY